jgi:hypothetical protein
LDFEFLYNQRKLHEAYGSKPLERKFKIVGVSSITEEASLFQPNKASHIVAYSPKMKSRTKICNPKREAMER